MLGSCLKFKLNFIQYEFGIRLEFIKICYDLNKKQYILYNKKSDQND